MKRTIKLLATIIPSGFVVLIGLYLIFAVVWGLVLSPGTGSPIRKYRAYCTKRELRDKIHAFYKEHPNYYSDFSKPHIIFPDSSKIGASINADSVNFHFRIPSHNTLVWIYTGAVESEWNESPCFISVDGILNNDDKWQDNKTITSSRKRAVLSSFENNVLSKLGVKTRKLNWFEQP